MNHCLRCNESYEVNSLFCARCRALLERREPEDGATESGSVEEDLPRELEPVAIADCITVPLPTVASKGAHTPLPASVEANPSVSSAVTPQAEARVSDELMLDQLATQPMPASVIPESPALAASRSDQVDEAFHKLNDAARLIAAEEPQMQGGMRAPRASRLAPFYDISDDIRRDSTPLPRTAYSTQPRNAYSRKMRKARDGQSSSTGLRLPSLPDLWPWLPEVDDDAESDLWPDEADPLQARRLPASIEQSKLEKSVRGTGRTKGRSGQRLTSERASKFFPSFSIPGRGRWRMVFMSLTALALVALLMDAVLVWFAVRAPYNTELGANGQPTLTLEQNTIQYGQKATLYIRNFTPNGLISLTRDIDVPILNNGSHSLLHVDDHGTGTVSLTIDNSWDPGMHSIQVEDIKQRFTANATLRVDAGPTRPAQLVLSTTNLDLGAGYEGGTTVQPLTLQNGGGGSISWSATSDQSWLTLSPSRGEFSDSMQISVGAARLNLAPQDYSATITIAANGEATQTVTVKMTVRALPDNVGAVLAVAPATLDFSAIDGGNNPDDQFLVVRNPGSQPLYWTIQDNATSQNTSMYINNDFALDANWLTTGSTAGVVPAQSQVSVRVSVRSSALLPGTYTKTLLFGVQKNHVALNAPTPVNVSLTVQSGCGVNLNANTLYFTAIDARSNPSSQSLNLMASDSCLGTVPWTASSSASWLTLAPSHGVVSDAAGAVVTASVDISALKPQNYTAVIAIATSHSTRTIAVDLTVQPTPTPTTPILGASPLSLNFGATVGQQGLAGQTVTLTNTGGTTLRWNTSVNLLASSWLGASPTGGTIEPGQSAQLTVNVSAGSLSPGTYAGQIELHGYDTTGAEVSGSPQIIAISFVVRPPCTLSAPSSQSLSFVDSSTGGSSPQTVTFSASGDCSWPLTWSANVQTANANWLQLSPVSGSFTNGSQTASLTLSVNRANLTASSSRRVSVLLSVTDRNGQSVSGGSSTIQVTLVKPCSIQSSPGSLAFTAEQGQSAAAQSLSLGTAGACQLPVSWSVTGDSNWLGFSATSGTLNGSGGALNVSANAGSLAIGSYSGTITLSAQDSTGAVTATVTVPVTLNVTGLTLSGTVNACSNTACSSPSALASATVTLTDSSSKTFTTTADSQGHYSFGNLPVGVYTLAASGSAGGTSYSGNAGSVNLSGDASMPVNTFAASATAATS